MKETMELLVANDNGNSEQDLIINGDLIQQPNVYAKVGTLPNLDDLNEVYMAKNLLDNLIVTITSPGLNNNTPTTYYVGEYTSKTGMMLSNIEIGAVNSKIESDVPVINTLANIAGYSVQNYYKVNEVIPEELTVKVDMVTALPVNQHSKDNAQIFANRFIGKHEVIVYLGINKVKVEICFDYVKVLPEGVTTAHYLNSKEDKTHILEEFCKDYNVDLKNIDFEDKKILHVAIGEGTTEYPLTEGISFNPNFIQGSPNGVGHAIEVVRNKFINLKNLSKFSRQDYSKVLKNVNHKYYVSAKELIEPEFERQADAILQFVRHEVTKANNEVDYICVYGGGSILMKEYLKANLLDFAEKTDIKVIYIPEPDAVTIEVKGMWVFANSKIFKALKKKFIGQK